MPVGGRVSAITDAEPVVPQEMRNDKCNDNSRR
jgi:hypothetical protein